MQDHDDQIAITTDYPAEFRAGDDEGDRSDIR